MNVVGKLIFLLRSIVVNTTHGTPPDGSSPDSTTPSSNPTGSVGTPLDDLPKSPGNLEAQDVPPGSLRQGTFDSESKLQGALETVEVVPVQLVLEDQPRARRWYRRLFGTLALLLLLPFAIAPVMGNWYPDAEHDVKKAKTVGMLR